MPENVADESDILLDDAFRLLYENVMIKFGVQEACDLCSRVIDARYLPTRRWKSLLQRLILASIER